jgi:hypothetical protein
MMLKNTRVAAAVTAIAIGSALFIGAGGVALAQNRAPAASECAGLSGMKLMECQTGRLQAHTQEVRRKGAELDRVIAGQEAELAQESRIKAAVRCLSGHSNLDQSRLTREKVFAYAAELGCK